MEYSCARMIRSPFHDLLLGSSHLTSTSEKYKPFSIIHGRRGPGAAMGPLKVSTMEGACHGHSPTVVDHAIRSRMEQGRLLQSTALAYMATIGPKGEPQV